MSSVRLTKLSSSLYNGQRSNLAHPNPRTSSWGGLYRPDLSQPDQWNTQLENNLQRESTLLMMEELLLSEKELELLLQGDDCGDLKVCDPPPMFSLPPPPIPPMINILPDCGLQDACHDMPVVTSINSLQNIFHSIIIIIVSSIIIVMSIILLVVIIRRSLIKKAVSKNILSPELDEKGLNLQTMKRSCLTQMTQQNYYITDQGQGVTQHHQPAPGLPSLLINGVPFHIIHPGTLTHLPIYETIESEYYSEMSSVGSDANPVYHVLEHHGDHLHHLPEQHGDHLHHGDHLQHVPGQHGDHLEYSIATSNTYDHGGVTTAEKGVTMHQKSMWMDCKGPRMDEEGVTTDDKNPSTDQRMKISRNPVQVLPPVSTLQSQVILHSISRNSPVTNL